jgi:hypothetical protein
MTVPSKRLRLVWNRKCPICKKFAIPQVNYPSFFYCFKGGHGMFRVIKRLGKTTFKFRYDGATFE